MRHHRIIKAVYKQTLRSEHKQPMAAALAQGSRVISFGINRINKSHPEQKRHPDWNSATLVSIHAELDALIRADYQQIEGSSIYIVRRKVSDGSYGLAKPCERCQQLLIEYGISKVIYTINSPIEEENCFIEEMV